MSRTGQALETVATFIDSNASAPGASDARVALEVVTERLIALVFEATQARRARAAFPKLLGGWF